MVEGSREFRKLIDKQVKMLTKKNALDAGARVRILKGDFKNKTGIVDGISSQTHISDVKSTAIWYLVLVDGKEEDGVYAYSKDDLQEIERFVCS